MPDPTDHQADAYSIMQEPWQSWGTTVRYLVYRVAQAAPSIVLLWLAYLRR